MHRDLNNCIRKRSILEFCKHPKRLAIAIVAFFATMALLLTMVFYV